MRPLRIVGPCVIAALALVVLGQAATAGAATYPLTGLPEIGRCVKLSTHTGVYRYKNCVVKSEGAKGTYEWEPGPGANGTFLAEAAEVKLETVGKARVSCASAELSGQWTGSKTASVTVALRGCQSLERGCGNNPGKPNEILTEEPVEGELGFIEKGEKPKVGLDLKPKSPGTTLFTFTCGGPPETTAPEPWIVEGSVIGKYRYANHMQQTFGLLYQATSGKQIPQKFDEGLKDTPLATRTVLTEPPPKTEEAGLTLREEETRKWIPGEFGEKLEVKAK